MKSFLRDLIFCPVTTWRLRGFLATARLRPVEPGASCCVIRIACNSASTAAPNFGSIFVRRLMATTLLLVSGMITGLSYAACRPLGSSIGARLSFRRNGLSRRFSVSCVGL